MSLSIRECLERTPATSKALQAATGLSQAAVFRQLRAMGAGVVRLASGRSPRYAITRCAYGGSDKLPLYMVDVHGNSVLVALIRPLAHGSVYLEADTGMPSVLLGESKDGIYDDLRPQGFFGRQIASALAVQSAGFPSDPRNWNADHVGRYLVSNGDDLPGNFKLGEQAHLRVRRKPLAVTEENYPELADSVMSGTIPSSSAGGEQPKFTAFCGDKSAHVIVKFSPKGGDVVARRWRDILITEYHAGKVIREREFPAEETRLVEGDGRLFLESQRFDRVGEYGRLPMLSLQAVDAEFSGLGSDWPQVVDALRSDGLLGSQHTVEAKILYCFGRFINNTDMHLGNLSLGIEGDVFRLLPVYDMCSMGFAPRSGEVLLYGFSPPELSGLNLDSRIIVPAKIMAHDFWGNLADDERISDEFREFLGRGNPIILGGK